jgi:hypothetical protein
VLRKAHILYVLTRHLQNDADPDPDLVPAYHFDADTDPDFYLMRMRNRATKMIWIQNTAYSYS